MVLWSAARPRLRAPHGSTANLVFVDYCVPRDNRGVKKGCGKVARIAEPIERLVTAAVLDVLDSPEMGRMLAAASENNEMRTLVDQYEGQKLKMNELIEDYASGLLNRDQLAHAKSIVESAMEETKRRMEKIQAGSIFRPLPPGTFNPAGVEGP